MGVIALIAAGVLSPSLVIWMSPTIAGLILVDPDLLGERAIVDRRGAAQDRPAGDAGGDAARRRSSRAPTRSRRSSSGPATTARTGLRAIVADPKFREAHEMFLPEAGRHRRGEIDVDEAVATAKLNDARTLDEACAWLKPKERLAVLNDRALISLLARLPTTHRARPGPIRNAADEAQSSG